MIFPDRVRVAKLAAESRLPTMFPFREIVEAGGLKLKTARLLGLTIPPALLARADHVIES